MSVSLINADFAEQEIKNRAKYGPRDDDHIAGIYKKSITAGDVWTGENAKKYITRFMSQSNKAKNGMDILKAIDYLVRMYEANKAAGLLNVNEVIDK